jgi:5-methylcytosine-specific restriction endonuclease McrA
MIDNSENRKPYLVECQKCHEIHRRSTRRSFTCDSCKGKTYPRTFYRNRKIVLERDKHRCQCCGDGKIIRIHIHHIDCNKSNNSTSNLIALCIQCHLWLHTHYSNEELRRSNIYLLFPKEFRWGQFGKRVGKKPEIPKVREIKKVVKFRNI